VLTDAEGFLGGGDPDDEEEQKASGQLTVNPLSLQRELLSCGEVLFQPKELLNDRDSSIVSVPELIAQVCNACDVDTREQLLSNIFLSGGVTTMRGFDRRFEAELKELLPYAAPYINVFGSQRRYATWQGGSVLAALDEFKDSWEYRDDEDEDEGDEMEEES
jgi:actin-related protein